MIISLLMKSATCLWCGRTFKQTDGPGRPPLYCSASHRQLAHQLGKQQEAVTSALNKQMRHVQDVVASVGGSGKWDSMLEEASRAQKVVASVGGSGKWDSMLEEASRAQTVFAASVAEQTRHLQSVFADGAVEATKALDGLTSRITEVASVHQAFAATFDEVSKVQASLASKIAESAALGKRELSRGFPRVEDLQSLAMSAPLVGLAGIAATRIEAAGFTDQFASALEDVASALSRADVETPSEEWDPSSEELFADHGELERLVCPGLDVVTTRVLLAVLVGASLPFISDALLTVSLLILGECWSTLRLFGEITHLDPAIPGLLTLPTVFGVVASRG